MLIDVMKQHLTQARKQKDQFLLTVLSTVIGEMSSNAVMVDGQKVVNDELAIRTIRKFIKGIDESLEKMPDNTDLQREREILKGYLPQMLTSVEISNALKDAIASGQGANIGAMMGYLKSNYPNLYDGKLASQLANEILKGHINDD